MKNYINYFYNMIVDNIYYINEKYIFQSGKQQYIFKQCNNLNIESYYMELESQLSSYGCFHKIILNRNNRVITTIEGRDYILLKTSIVSDNTITYNDLKQTFYVYNIEKLSIINHFPWYTFWKQKIDYMEDWLESKKEKYKNTYPWFQFFIGLSENAVMYAQEIEFSKRVDECDRLSFQHCRVNRNSTQYDYYDPSNLIVDHSSRDIGEYIKTSILNGTFNIEEFITYVRNGKFSKYWIKELYARILFPSFFFDHMEEIMNTDDHPQPIFTEKYVVAFLNALRQIGERLNEEYHIPIVNWTIKKT